MLSAEPATTEVNSSLINIQHVSKRYRSTQALKDFSLEIPRGTTYGLIGPNGAGKTTLMRILVALIAPSSGQVWFENDEVRQNPMTIHHKVAYIPTSFTAYPVLPCPYYLY